MTDKEEKISRFVSDKNRDDSLFGLFDEIDYFANYFELNCSIDDVDMLEVAYAINIIHENVEDEGEREHLYDLIGCLWWLKRKYCENYRAFQRSDTLHRLEHIEQKDAKEESTNA